MLNSFLEKLYRLSTKALPCELCSVYLLDLNECVKPAKSTNDYEFRLLTASEVSQFTKKPEHQLNDHHMKMVVNGTARCFGVLHGHDLAAYIWFSQGIIDSEENSGGQRLLGTRIELPSKVIYMFKGLVMPEHRGHALMNSLFYHSVQLFKSEGLTHSLTTTEWTNKAFRISAERAGFKLSGFSGELAIGHKVFFKLPQFPEEHIRFLGGSHSELNSL